MGILARNGLIHSVPMFLFISSIKPLNIMSQNGQTHFKNLAANVARILKCV